MGGRADGQSLNGADVSLCLRHSVFDHRACT